MSRIAAAIALLLLPAAAVAAQPGSVAEVRFSGEERLIERDLSSTVTVSPGEKLDPAKLEDSRRKLLERRIFDDVSYSIEETPQGAVVTFHLQPVQKIADIRFHGAESIALKQLRRGVGVRSGDAFKTFAPEGLNQRVREFYRDRGFFETTVTTDTQPGALGVTLDVTVVEGASAHLEKCRLEQEIDAPARLAVESACGEFADYAASKDNIQGLNRRVLAALRNSGFLQASAHLERLEYDAETKAVYPVFTVIPRDELKIEFEGNKRFTREELLAPLRLEERRVPVSPSTLHILCRSIERMYQEEGYYNANAEYELESGDDGKRTVKITIGEGGRVFIKRIRFEGNTAFSGRKLLRTMQTRQRSALIPQLREKGALIKEIIESDLSAIEERYFKAGYVGTKASAENKFEEDEITLIIHIAEGQLALIKAASVNIDESRGKLVFAENEEEQRAELELRDIAPGGPFIEESIDEEKQRLLKTLLKLGYPTASVRVSASREEGTVQFTLDPGPRITVGKIIPQGNLWTDDHVLLRELTLDEGSYWVPEDLLRSERSLGETGLFRSVSLAPADGQLDSSVEELAVRVEERETGRFSLGAAFNNEDGLHLTAELRQANLGGHGNAVTAGVDGFFKNSSRVFEAGRAKVLFDRPHVFDTDADMFSEAYVQYSVQSIDVFSHDRIGISNGLRWSIGENVKAALIHALFHERVYDVEPDVIIGEDDEGTSLYSIVGADLSWDKRDDRYNPRKGFFVSLQPKLSSGALGSEAEYAGIGGQFLVYRPLSSRLVWVNSARGAYLDPYGDSGTIPLSQRFFLGGRNSLRGFSRNSIGPRGREGNIAGGDSEIIFNTELQYALTEGLSTVFFVDAGQAFLEHQGSFDGTNQEGLSDLRYSPGIGLRYKTPIGPLSIDYGVALDREFGERFGHFSFGVGGAF